MVREGVDIPKSIVVDITGNIAVECNSNHRKLASNTSDRGISFEDYLPACTPLLIYLDNTSEDNKAP